MATTDVNTPASNPQPRIHIHHHCIVTKLIEVNASLSNQCKEQLRTTPFGWLLNLHCNIKASGWMLKVMFATWNVDECAFKVGDKLIPFTLYDVALILGCPWRGSQLIVVSLMVWGWWKHWSPISRQLGRLGQNWWYFSPNLLQKSQIGLCYIWPLSWPIFLFPTNNKKVNPNLLALLDDIPKLSSYAWWKAVYEYLICGLNRAAASKKARNNRGNLYI